jgi:hypothetical protein
MPAFSIFHPESLKTPILRRGLNSVLLLFRLVLTRVIRLAITATYEAIEMAGLVPNRTPSTRSDRIGVFFGVTSDDWREVNSGQNIDTYFIPGGNRAFIPGRIRFAIQPSSGIGTN